MKTIEGKKRMNKQEEFIERIDNNFFIKYFKLLEEEDIYQGMTSNSKSVRDLFEKYQMQGVYRIDEYKGFKFVHILVDDNKNVLIYMLNEDKTICNYKIIQRI